MSENDYRVTSEPITIPEKKIPEQTGKGYSGSKVANSFGASARTIENPRRSLHSKQCKEKSAEPILKAILIRF